VNRSDTRELLKKIVWPVLDAGQKNELKRCMPVELAPQNTTNRAQYAHLEAVGRSFCGIAPMLELEYQANGHVDEVYQAAVLTLDNISSPDSPGFLNFSTGAQPLVDAAFLATAFLRAPNALWLGLNEKTQSNLVNALRSTRSIKPHFNNWLLFSAVIEAFFCKNGLEWDAMRVDYALRQHEKWFIGDGTYGDGPEFHLDYYNSFVIQPLLLEILWAVSGKYKEWDKLYEQVLARAQIHAVQLERLIGPDGTFPPIGRSLAYRSGAFHLMSLLAWKQKLPSELKPAQVRCALTAVIYQTLICPSNFDGAGWLRIGINSSQPSMGESYMSTGSLYLCTTAFLGVGLPQDDSYWNDADENWTQKSLWWLKKSLS